MKKILSNLRKEGFKITKAREGILKFLESTKLPVSAFEIKECIQKEGLRRINKTTIYRELQFLKAQDIIVEVDFGDGKKRYEMKRNHHHHVICVNCEKIEEIKLNKSIICQEEENISKASNFTIVDHYLEFLGVCRKCQP